MDEFTEKVSHYNLKLAYLLLIPFLIAFPYMLKVYSGDPSGVLSFILTPTGFLTVLMPVLMLAMIFCSFMEIKANQDFTKPVGYKYSFFKTTSGKILLVFTLVSIAYFYISGVLNYRTILTILVLFGILIAFAYLRNKGVSLISQYLGGNKVIAIIIAILTLAGIFAIQGFAPTIIKSISNPYDLSECFTKFRIDNSMTSSCVGRHAAYAKNISLCNELHRIYEGNDYVLQEFVCTGVYNDVIRGSNKQEGLSVKFNDAVNDFKNPPAGGYPSNGVYSYSTADLKSISISTQDGNLVINYEMNGALIRGLQDVDGNDTVITQDIVLVIKKDGDATTDLYRNSDALLLFSTYEDISIYADGRRGYRDYTRAYYLTNITGPEIPKQYRTTNYAKGDISGYTTYSSPNTVTVSYPLSEIGLEKGMNVTFRVWSNIETMKWKHYSFDVFPDEGNKEFII